MASIGSVEEISEHKLVRYLDLFLYPTNISGFVALTIFIMVPPILDFVRTLLGLFALSFATGGLIIVIKIIVYIYMYWYLGQCIHDSASGGLRAPDTCADNVDIMDMFWQTVKILFCFVIFWGPLICYGAFIYGTIMANFTQGPFPLAISVIETSGPVFLLLLAYAIFFFPMALLAVILFDCLSGFNPILVIGSIFKTFIPYLGLILSLCGIAGIFYGLRYILPYSQISIFLLSCVQLYLVIVATHVLGRFYYINSKKLDWDV